jgi:AraC family transcriptional regulator
LILTELPDLPPRPETAANAAFRREFYSRWGREWSIVAGCARRAEYSTYRQSLSIKTVAQGREHYFLDGRRITVTPADYLVLNEGRSYGSLLESPGGASSFCLFFPFGAASRTQRAMRESFDEALDRAGDMGAEPIEFSEHLRPHDRLVSPVLRHIQREVRHGASDAGWLEEQFEYLLVRLLRSDQAIAGLPDRLDCARPATRRELVRRLGWALDYMRSNLHADLALADLSNAARLSTYHFLRVFRQVHGVTPVAYLRALRTDRALELLRSTDLEVNVVADQVGMTRLSLWRAVRRRLGTSPSDPRTRAALGDQGDGMRL